MPFNLITMLSLASILGLVAVGSVVTGYGPVGMGWDHMDMMDGEGHHGNHDHDHGHEEHNEECEQYRDGIEGNSTKSDHCK